MTTGTSVVGGIIACVVAAALQSLGAQARCSSSPATADSARADLAAVMSSGSPLVAELRMEQRLPADETGEHAAMVKEPAACARIAALFNHAVPPKTTLSVLRMGSLYYARDPDQRQSTGLLTDSTFKVLLRLGRSIQGSP